VTFFSDLDFLGSALTDFPLIENRADQSTAQICCHAAATENETGPSTSASTLASNTLQGETPRSLVNTEEVSDVLKILSPLPEAPKKRLSVRRRRTQKSETLTSSPFKNELKEKNKDSRKMPKTTKKKKDKSLSNKESPTPEPRSHDQETECNICGESFDVEWIQCNTCEDWAHEAACVDMNPADVQDGSNMTGTDLCVNNPHCVAAVRP